MIGRLKAIVRRHWPALHLRTILFATLLLVAALPGFGALFLRVYENTVVRQTEAELVSQGAALAATAAQLWPGRQQPVGQQAGYAPEPPAIDLSSAVQLPERPASVPAARPADPAAETVAAMLQPVMAETARTTLASLRLIDRSGVVVGGPEAGRQLVGVVELQAALGGRPSTVLRRNGAYSPRYSMEWLSRAAAVRLHHARPVIVDGKVAGAILLSRSPRALFRGIYEDRGKIALGVALIFSALVVLAGLLSRGIARPIDRLASATRSVAAGGGDVPEPPATAAIEIRDLYRNFAQMAEAIGHRSRYLRDFATAVSHEFKTPLTSIRGSVELLQDHGDMSEAERVRFLANIAADANRLNLLVSRLLDLARADMQPARDERADLRTILRQSADSLSSEGFTVEMSGFDAAVPVICPAASLETIATILIDNARLAGASRVRFSHASPKAEQVELICDDNGPGIPEADRQRVFEPFFTSRRAGGGTGLGLPIARSLLEAASASIRLEPMATGSRFVIVLRSGLLQRAPAQGDQVGRRA
ncbi:HAMP domain-containing histidine kinase [Sandaracinobacter neustonicus]|uniref:Signal transduction histidine-protein kinase/phosphatase MprB n=1 Tax=Sandaracinobacter neustonicus TaxID=1715348 RepID=A0A501XDA5_9SPHN|nr:HAMP domain-containing sensor histidine kinase [Sandaracinobacter neustonicus]TPE58575.1 HAMP domain-containing histidine kinase [Sandaracinobacter neustonicus]